MSLAYKVQVGFTYAPERQPGYCAVKDGDGNVKHYIDPITRKKLSITEMEAINKKREANK